MEKEAVEQQDSPLVIDTMSIAQAQEQFKRLQQFIRTQMVKDRDFGIIPGCKKPSLWKPGAERLLFFHGLGCKLESTSDTVVDWKNEFFNYCYRATVFNPRTDVVIATAEGSCNSKEPKYRYLWLYERELPRGTDKDMLEFRGEEDSMQYRVDNHDICGLVNTIQKMGSKRALVAAVLIACRASDAFTQDDGGDGEHGTVKKKGDPKERSKTGDEISQPQDKRLYAIRKSVNLDDVEFKQYLIENYSYVVDSNEVIHTNLIKWRDYKAICKWVEAMGNEG